MKDSVPGVAKSVYEGEGMSLSDQIRDDLSGNGNRYSGISVGTTEQKKNDSGQPLYYDASGNETTTDTGNPVYITVFDGNDQYLSEDFERDYSIDTSNPDQTAPGQPGADLVIGELDEDDSDRGDAAAILDGFTKRPRPMRPAPSSAGTRPSTARGTSPWWRRTCSMQASSPRPSPAAAPQAWA